MRDGHARNLYLGTFSFTCLCIYVYLWMLGVCVFVFICMGCTMCVHGHTSVRMGRHVGCVCRPGRTGYPCLFTLNAISVSGLSALLTKLRPGAFAFLVPELFRAFLDMINEIPQNQEPKRILPSLSYPMRKIAKYLVWHYTQTNLRAGYFAAVFLLLSPL